MPVFKLKVHIAMLYCYTLAMINHIKVEVEKEDKDEKEKDTKEKEDSNKKEVKS